MSAYYLEHANVEHVLEQFESFEEDAQSLLSLGLAIPAYGLKNIIAVFHFICDQEGKMLR